MLTLQLKKALIATPLFALAGGRVPKCGASIGIFQCRVEASKFSIQGSGCGFGVDNSVSGIDSLGLTELSQNPGFKDSSHGRKVDS